VTAGIARHRTALSRRSLSRPVALSIDSGVLTPERTILDFGCGRGTDVRHLQALGYQCKGWDPAFFPDAERQPADVVNLGYVVNVIERAEERAEVLRTAWSLARVALIVSARLTSEENPFRGCAYSDGVVTSLGTFQKVYQQDELRTWVETTLGVPASAAAPGVFFVFRDPSIQQAVLASRHRQRLRTPPVERSTEVYEANRLLLDDLMDFVARRGRLPVAGEFPSEATIRDAFGSIGRAFGVIRRITNPTLWERIRRTRSQDVLVYLALSRFRGRLRFSQLPDGTQRDIRSLLGSYVHACKLADELLLRAGKMDAIERACSSSEVGKLTGNALYVHVSALERLHPLLRVYEGCGAALVGHVEGATLIKLARMEPRVSYLAYPDFDRDPHPTLASSWVVSLRDLRVDLRDFRGRQNPPVLHRKETFVATDYAGFEKFARLTRQEELAGLLADSSAIGTRDGWNRALAARGLGFKGHRLVSVSGRS